MTEHVELDRRGAPVVELQLDGGSERQRTKDMIDDLVWVGDREVFFGG